MKLARQIISIIVVLLFLGVTFAPSISASSPPASVDKQKTLTIWMPGITPNDYATQVQVTEEQYNSINDGVDDFLATVETAMSPESDGGINITANEWNALKTKAIAVIDEIKLIVGDDFPDLDVETFVGGVVESLLNPFSPFAIRAAIFSIGRGWAWVPFYKYEGFAGIMIRPIFISYSLGYTGVFHFNPIPLRVEYADKFGMYRIRTMGFIGLFFNFGDIGVDRIKGPVIVIGKGWNML
jgi:hypothetical protein